MVVTQFQELYFYTPCMVQEWNSSVQTRLLRFMKFCDQVQHIKGGVIYQQLSPDSSQAQNCTNLKRTKFSFVAASDWFRSFQDFLYHYIAFCCFEGKFFKDLEIILA